MTQLAAGKTKTVTTADQPGLVVLHSNDTLTAGDAARKTHIPGIGRLKTRQAANSFSLLRDCGIATAFHEQFGPSSLLCDDCSMLPLEWVVRRIPWGSYFARHPGERGNPQVVQPFDTPKLEQFHKFALVTGSDQGVKRLMPELDARAQYLHDGQWAAGVYTDPFLQRHDAESWIVRPAKASLQGPAEELVIDAMLTPEEEQHIFSKLIIPSFACLESSWRRAAVDGDAVSLVDCKFEIGRRKSDGELVVADVIDNDSWRLWPGQRPERQIDKQLFREGADDAQVLAAYELVTQLTDNFGSKAP